MAALFADENVHQGLVDALRTLGHDVLTAHEAGRANQKIPDADQLAYAANVGRVMLTNNRKHFHNLQRTFPGHSGIITYTRDQDTHGLAQRIHNAISAATVSGVLIRIVRPP